MAKDFKTTIILGGKVAASLRQALKFAQSETGKTVARMHSMKKISGSLTSSVAELGGVLAAAFSVQKIMDTADAWLTVRSRVGLVTSSVQEQHASLDQLFAISQKTRQEYEATSDLYAKIAMNAKQLNLANKDALGITETVNKALRIGGGGVAQNQAAILQLGQALASGRLQGDELRSLMENAPRLTKAIAEGLGVATGSLKEMGKEGLLTSDVIIKALQSQAGVIDKEFTKMPVTIRGALTYAENAFGKFVDKVGQDSDVFNKLADRIIRGTDSAVAFADYVVNNWDSIAPIIEGITVALVGLKAGLAVQWLIGAAAKSWMLYKAANEGATIAQWALNAAMSANPIGLVAIGIAAVIAAIYYLWKNWDKVSTWFGDKIDWLKEKLFGWAEWLAGIGTKIGKFLNSINPFDSSSKPAQYASGGFANRPSVFGEAGLEAAIPIKPRNPRSLSLLNRTAQMLGVGGGGQGHTFVYAPQVSGGNPAETRAILEDERMKFEEQMSRWVADEGRLAF